MAFRHKNIKSKCAKYGLNLDEIKKHPSIQGIGLDKIIYANDGTYYPDKNGEYRIIVGLKNKFELIDLLALNPKNQKEWTLRRNCLTHLNSMTDLIEPDVTEILHVWKYPLTWLKKGCVGTSIIDKSQYFSILTQYKKVIIEDPDMSKILKTVVSIKPNAKS